MSIWQYMHNGVLKSPNQFTSHSVTAGAYGCFDRLEKYIYAMVYVIDVSFWYLMVIGIFFPTQFLGYQLCCNSTA